MLFRKTPTFSENDLPSVIQACVSHDSQAQRVLIEQFYGYAKTVIMPYAAHKMEAEEILNDGFLKVFMKIEKYDASNSFKAWLRTILVNTAIDYYRKNKKNVFTSDISEIDVPSFDEDIISRISAEEILALVQKLSPSCRLIFTMYVIEGYNHREIAEKLNIKEGTSKSNLSDARLKLQELIRKNYPHLFAIYSLKNERFNEN